MSEPIYPETEQPVEDWAEQREAGDPADAGSENGDMPGTDADAPLEADEADLAEQARVLADDEPYPHD